MEKRRLTLDPGEKAAIGKMAIENVQDHAIELDVTGEGPVLRGKMIVQPEDANTPSLKVYCMVVSMYLDPDKFTAMSDDFLALSREIVLGVPSMGMLMADVGEAVRDGRFEDALGKSLELLKYEEFLTKVANGEAEMPQPPQAGS
ncbi:MAG: flagellar biosynthesis repressor FlbT [Rhodospirillales bacterium]